MKVNIRNKLSLYWSPEQIAGYFRCQNVDCVSLERIYQMIWQDKRDGGELIAKELGINVYFARPYHSWERGCNENWNGLLRQFFPTGTSFEGTSPEKLPICTYLINTRPGKKLGFISPASKISCMFANDTAMVHLVNSVAFVS